MSPEFRVDLLEVRFGPARISSRCGLMHFRFALGIRQRLLLRVLELGRMLIEPLAGFPARASADSSRCVCSCSASRNAAIRCSASVAALVADSRAAVA